MLDSVQHIPGAAEIWINESVNKCRCCFHGRIKNILETWALSPLECPQSFYNSHILEEGKKMARKGKRGKERKMEEKEKAREEASWRGKKIGRTEGKKGQNLNSLPVSTSCVTLDMLLNLSETPLLSSAKWGWSQWLTRDFLRIKWSIQSSHCVESAEWSRKAERQWEWQWRWPCGQRQLIKGEEREEEEKGWRAGWFGTRPFGRRVSGTTEARRDVWCGGTGAAGQVSTQGFGVNHTEVPTSVPPVVGWKTLGKWLPLSGAAGPCQ